jgi:hypothetical protein
MGATSRTKAVVGALSFAFAKYLFAKTSTGLL